MRAGFTLFRLRGFAISWLGASAASGAGTSASTAATARVGGEVGGLAAVAVPSAGAGEVAPRGQWGEHAVKRCRGEGGTGEVDPDSTNLLVRYC